MRLRDPLKKITPLQWVLTALLVTLIVIEHRVPVLWMYRRRILEASYYSHGFVVPVVSLWLVWRDRNALFSLYGGTVWPGLFLLVAGQLILVLSGLAFVFFTGMFGMILTIWGLAGFLFGSRVLMCLGFPYSFSCSWFRCRWR